MREHRNGLVGERRRGQYVWRDPESDEQLRVDVFGSEEFFEDLRALGFVPGGGAPDASVEGEPEDGGPGDRPARWNHPQNGLDGAEAAGEAPIRHLHGGGRALHPRGTSEGRAEVRRRGA